MKRSRKEVEKRNEEKIRIGEEIEEERREEKRSEEERREEKRREEKTRD